MRTLLLVVLLLSIFCTNPLCGFTPERFAVVLRGTPSDAGGAPLSGHCIHSETDFPWDTLDVALTLTPVTR